MFSIIILIIPKASLLSANGSLELVGFSFMPKKPTRVSILSVIDRAALKDFLGTGESKPIGKYCSDIAREISLSNP